MLKLFARLLPTILLKPMMSEVGASIYDLMQDDVNAKWVRDSGRHTLTEEKSGIALWIANGYMFFKLWRVDATDIRLSETEVKEMLNPADVCVLWRGYHRMSKNYQLRHEKQNRTTVANLARMALIKEDENV